jgi:transcriptional regulator with GAF, ATPase, and Fis domain
VRELRNVIERGVLLETGDVLRARNLPSDLVSGTAAAAAAGTNSRDDHDLTLRTRLRSEERRLLEEALRRSEGVRREAARLLGIDERNLSYYMRKHGI